jgi:hypothetical protein
MKPARKVTKKKPIVKRKTARKVVFKKKTVKRTAKTKVKKKTKISLNENLIKTAVKLLKAR